MTIDADRVVSLVMQVQGDFLAWPALHVTLADAERRFGADRQTCEAVLDALVDSGVLARTADGGYVRYFPHLAHAA
jgi:hypothetical protein